MAVKLVDGLGREFLILHEDMICRNCKFNFVQGDGDPDICAAHESRWGYGEEIEDEKETCNEFDVSFDFYNDLVKKEFGSI